MIWLDLAWSGLIWLDLAWSGLKLSEYVYRIKDKSGDLQLDVKESKKKDEIEVGSSYKCQVFGMSDYKYNLIPVFPTSFWQYNLILLNITSFLAKV